VFGIYNKEVTGIVSLGRRQSNFRRKFLLRKIST
jgi:hypothetical protein